MMKKKHFSFEMFLVTIGIVYGDIGTSPMYVMKSIIEGNGGLNDVTSELIIGSLSLVIWTITLLTTMKYVIIAMKADNHGEGGIFALYSLVKKCGPWLIFPAMVGGAALLADGVLTPAVTVTTAIEGLRSIPLMDRFLGDGQNKVLVITLSIILVLFIVHRAGTGTIGRFFGPVMLLWFLFLAGNGLLNIGRDFSVLRAFNPLYAIKVLFSPANKKGFMILGSIFLAATGAEALYSDMGHVGKSNIYFSWPFVKICLILNYLGQGAWIIRNRTDLALAELEGMNPFFMMLPEVLRPFAILLSTAAAIIASQALITGSYTLVSEAVRLDLMPHLKVEYPSDTKGQIYIGTVNLVLWAGCTLVVLYFRTSARMEAAYGLAITVTMLMTTLLLSVYIGRIWGKRILALTMLFVFGAIEAVFFISSLSKFMIGGYITVMIALVILFIMIIWHHGTELENRHSVRLSIENYIDNLNALRMDESIPRIADNIVYIENSAEGGMDRDILYSILDKDPKRARAHWFISVNVMDDPDTMSYEVETYGTDYIFRVRLNLGYKVEQCVNVYIRQIIRDLLSSGEMPPQERKFSIYGNSDVGSFKFCVLKKSVPSTRDLSAFDAFVLNTKYAIRTLAGSKARWYGLDTSSQIVERVPLIINSSAHREKIRRIRS